ncbi:hypothetical protein [Kurthia huakuii]|uniref:hypothetical protein n=1 Tax=Kurthia huakuii TaxID=1421019 RepID=UPI000495BEBE|nr:hypothetical protein [Kurthia huakuii]MBM7697978.1 FtsZ-interacting cell division protein ZipA [Kurthia huakuii]
MEGLIIFIIISLIGYFFSGKKGEGKSKKKRPTTADKPNRLEDLMQQMKDKMNDIEQETKPLSKRQEQAKKVAQQAKKRAEQLAQQPHDKAHIDAFEHTVHHALEQTPSKRVHVKSMDQMLNERLKPVTSKQHPLFHSKNDVKRAVLMAEVLAPPKAKRK